MDEQAYLDRIRSLPGDTDVLREYAKWLTASNDPRGEYLTVELDLREAEARRLQLRSRIDGQAALRRLEPGWLDAVLPLTVKSPMAGTFYAAPNPDAPPFVKPGDLCYPETIIGLVEAMKVFNEIPADQTGVVTKVLAVTLSSQKLQMTAYWAQARERLRHETLWRCYTKADRRGNRRWGEDGEERN